MTDAGGRPAPPRFVLHVDMDQYIAAVEIRRRPELAGRPVVVGGSGDPTAARQVVATASYEARAFGVRSGMPLRLALRRCPEAVFLASDREAYDRASAEVMGVLRAAGHPVEVWGWDEAFVGADLPAPEGAVALGERLRADVLRITRLTCAIGVGETRLQAKTATGLAKRLPLDRAAPGRVAVLTDATWLPTLGAEPTTALWGIGPRTQAKLAAHGIRTVAELAAASEAELAGWFGPTIGPHLRRLGRGGGRSVMVTEPDPARSRSKQVTFPRDLTDRAEIQRQVGEFAVEVATSVFAEGRVATHVGVTVRTSTFFTRVRTGKLPAPTTDPEAVRLGALRVLDRFELDRPVRLLGVQVVLADP